ncbi:tetratricopeptide repeat protein [Necator americanus]|uniref:Cell division cycle protein 27 homolog n=1 Tax=Necator americanus TaxID=51031 RepID=W2TWQ3_NECAM|nr:tetratricopeptide repeat protein [Necator americanus]ETN86109.1 tetratricopeptide repeat protein [Necator americanus]
MSSSDHGEETLYSDTEALIRDCLDHSSLDDALFLAELIHLRVKSDQSLILYCDCLLRLNRKHEVYNLLRSHSLINARLRYLFAKCCFDLNKNDECCRVLSERKEGRLHDVFIGTPTEPFAHSLLSTIQCLCGRYAAAAKESESAVRLNNFLWSSVCKIVQFDDHVMDDLFRETTERIFLPSSAACAQTSDPVYLANPTDSLEKPQSTPSDNRVPPIRVTPNVNAPTPPIPTHAPRKSTRIHEACESRRAKLFSQNQDSENAGGRNRATPPRLNKVRQQHSLRAITRINEMGPSSVISRPERSPSSRKQKLDVDSKQSLSSNTGNVRSIAAPVAQLSAVSTSTSFTSTCSASSSTSNRNDADIKEFSPVYKDLFLCVKSFALIEDAIGSYNWSHAKKILDLVPPWMADLPVALHMRARIAFELTEYSCARDILQKLRRMYPHRAEGMELLSTALWHLQDAHELSSLAQHLTREARSRPQTWCVAGNCFSLQRQHAKAIDCMERAIQLDPYFAYAYTLLGHELIFQEEYDRAANAFRRALEISPKDYRAWHGLGLVHLRKEQMGLAQVNISKAVTINPTNRAMLCQLAQIEQALNRPERAMRLTDRALALDPDDVACRYNRARLLFDTKRNEECVKELNELKEVSPDEAYIYHLLGI